MEAGLTWLVVLALVASVIGAFYYLRLIKTMWFDESENEFVQAPKTLWGLSTISALLVFPLFLLPFLAVRSQGIIAQAAASLF